MSDLPTAENSGLLTDGERFIPGMGDMFGEAIELEHLHRYLIVKNLAEGLDVLDIACGEGYGSNLIAQVAKSTTGVDISAEAIDHASHKYVKNNLSFIRGMCEKIPCADSSVDLIVSFETIEHHVLHDEMMVEFKRVMRPNGVLVISSPNKLEYSDKPNYQNPFHLKELYLNEFESLIGKYFKNIKTYGQRAVVASAIGALKGGNTVSFNQYIADKNNVFPKPATSFAPQDPLYFITVAGNAELFELGASIYEHKLSITDLDPVRLEQLQKQLQAEKKNAREQIMHRDSMLAVLTGQHKELTTQHNQLLSSTQSKRKLISMLFQNFRADPK
jgi:O-antigen biosynthesis protein